MRRTVFEASRRAAARGFSLIELMVSVTIGLVVTLAVFGVLAASEARKRNATSLNDINQSGVYATYILDRAIRSAGTGFAQAWPQIGGCRVNATLRDAGGGVDIGAWPRAGALPAPFAGVPQTLRLAPVIAFRNASAAGSDVIQVMNTSGGFGEAPPEIGPGSLTSLRVVLPNSIGIRANDLLLVAGSGECQLTQVAAAKPLCAGDPTAAPGTACAPVVEFAGRYHNASGTGFASVSAGRGFAVPLGNATTNPPQLMLYGVGANSTLFSYDTLLIDGNDAAQPVAENVRALYAAYATDPGVLDGTIVWQAPTATGAWSGASLSNGSAASNTLLREIVAVRIGVVMRSSLVEREDVAPASLTLFSDLPAGVQRTLDLTGAGESRRQRHRVVEVTVPLRNFLLRP
ncbi:MAG TPA: PilW family protein [Methylibium sp.]|uniref:PilW family protein n=1 Tax=Methylibium sp. TaxID=2067992 RepID=UPI002DB75688|nr:PilW family protein [Methylibium sp.]HEU4460942.1 PilW family protein [Methylibium sp.]